MPPLASRNSESVHSADGLAQTRRIRRSLFVTGAPIDIHPLYERWKLRASVYACCLECLPDTTKNAAIPKIRRAAKLCLKGAPMANEPEKAVNLLWAVDEIIIALFFRKPTLTRPPVFLSCLHDCQ